MAVINNPGLLKKANLSIAMDQLISYLHSIHPLSDGLVNHLRTNLKHRQFDKKSFLLKAGHTSNQIYFIVNGLVRCFYLKDSLEISSWFMKEGDVIVSVESFFTQTPSKESIQALEETSVYYLDYAQLQFLYRHYPEFNYVGRVLTEKYYTLSEQRLYSLRMQRSAERYEYMMQYFPALIQRVPSKFIASYLGLTEETLSRIRSKK